MKKVIKCILIIIAILVILVSCYFIFFRSFKLSNHIAFRRVYSGIWQLIKYKIDVSIESA